MSNHYEIESGQLTPIDIDIIKPIIQNAFGQQLTFAYIKELLETKPVVYLEKDCRGVAVVVPKPGEGLCAYMDILAVREDYQRNGLGSELIDRILKDQKPSKLAWRSKMEREINLWYSRITDGQKIFEAKNKCQYYGYHIGLSPEEFGAMVKFMQQRPSHFE